LERAKSAQNENVGKFRDGIVLRGEKTFPPKKGGKEHAKKRRDCGISGTDQRNSALQERVNQAPTHDVEA